MERKHHHPRPNKTRGLLKWLGFNSWVEAAAVLVILVALCAGTIGFFYHMVASDKRTYAYEDTTTYWVEQGDTLWKIACEYSNERQDVRRVVDIIEDLNDCTPIIYPGQCLTIPVFDK